MGPKNGGQTSHAVEAVEMVDVMMQAVHAALVGGQTREKCRTAKNIRERNSYRYIYMYYKIL